jgi:ElaB/YqjD/DUF883 family membrane-anchored ribosome-binding protein
MEDQAELIREDMKETRENLTDKLETLEEKVTDSLSAAQHSVTDTVETIKEGVQESVASVREALDIPRHVREHPWLMMGGGVLVGFVAHSLLMPSRRSRRSQQMGRMTSSGGVTTTAGESPNGSGWNLFGSTWQKLRRSAARTALDLVGRAAKQSLPGELGASISSTVDEMSSKLRDDTPAPMAGSNS